MVLWLWFESVRVMFSLFIILNALPVPMLRQVILLLGEKKKERVWERKGLGIRVDRRLADFGFSVFSVSFSAPFLKASFSVLFQFLGAFGGPKGGYVWLVFAKGAAFLERWDPRFCTPI